MPIYEASFLGEAKPIKKAKKSPTKKAPPSDSSIIDLEEPVKPSTSEPPPIKKSRKAAQKPQPPPETVQLALPPPIKKSRKRKIQEPTPSEEDAITPVPPPPVKKARKKAAPKPNGSLPATSEESEIVQAPKVQDSVQEKRRARPPKKIVIHEGIQTTDEPPLWFKRWHEDERKRKAKGNNERVSATVLRQEAHTQANSQWQNGHTRDRVINEVDGHMDRLYKMIHSRSH